MTGTVRQILRQATASAHQRLHGHPILASLSTPSLSIDQYIGALRALYGIHASADNRLAELWPSRTRKSTFISSDIELLNGKIHSDDTIFNMPICQYRSQFLGVRYVIDGSTFGARALSVNVWRTLGLNTKNGASFLNAPEVDTISEWRQLLDWLEELTTPEEQEDAQHTAEAVFLEIEKWLGKCCDKAVGIKLDY